MNIHIICVGKLKETYWQEAVREYAKRLGGYCRLLITEVKEEKAPERLSAAEELLVRQTEGEAIAAQIKKGSHVVALDIKGQQMTSEELAGKLEKLAAYGKGNITFLIGGSLGLSADILSKSDDRLSFSPMTFPHQMMRVILTEQIYRAFKIIRNETYHK